MQAVCDTLEQLVREGVLRQYAVGGATAAGFHGEPLATRDVDVFVFLEPPPGSQLISLDPLYKRLDELGFNQFKDALQRYRLFDRWKQWSDALGLDPSGS